MIREIINYILRVATCISQVANAILLFGDPDETISGRAYRRGTLDGNLIWMKVGKFINKIFFFQYNHVKSSYDHDIKRAKRVVEQHGGRGYE